MRLLEKNEMKEVSGGLRAYHEVRYAKRGVEGEVDFLIFGRQVSTEEEDSIIEFCQLLINEVLKDSSNSLRKVGPFFSEDTTSL